MKIHYNKDFECYMVAECHKTNVIELDGVQLIPMTELEKLKTEFENREGVFTSYHFVKAIDRHIAELRGENK